jgi:ferredoxin-type protein NapH
MRTQKLRIIIPAAVLVVLAVGYIANLNFGTLSNAGWSIVSIICPIGALTTLLAQKLLVPRVVITLVIMVVLMIVLGKAFCAWICPVPLVQRLRHIFSGPKPLQTAQPAPRPAAPRRKRGDTWDARHIILGGSLLSALVFGFPVFCLVCPVGLTFATIFLVINLFSGGDLTWAIILAPAILAVEAVFFRKWCSQICPISALMSLCGHVGRFFRPTINDATCLETSAHQSCGICGQVCPEQIDPRHYADSASAFSECSKCRACVVSCPSASIKLSFWSKKAN